MQFVVGCGNRVDQGGQRRNAVVWPKVDSSSGINFTKHSLIHSLIGQIQTQFQSKMLHSIVKRHRCYDPTNGQRIGEARKPGPNVAPKLADADVPVLFDIDDSDASHRSEPSDIGDGWMADNTGDIDEKLC